MNDSLEIRKQQLVNECREIYAPQRRKWWRGSPDNSYEFTWDIYIKKNYPRVFAEEIIVRNNKTESLTAFGICIGLGLPVAVFMWNDTHSVVSLIFAIIIAVTGFFFYKQSRDRRPKIILNSREGLWTRGWQFFIPWKEIVVSCIRENNSGESTDYYLRVHYYDEQADEFKQAEYNIGGLEKEPTTIACFVQQFRILYGNDRPFRNTTN